MAASKIMPMPGLSGGNPFSGAQRQNQGPRPAPSSGGGGGGGPMPSAPRSYEHFGAPPTAPAAPTAPGPAAAAPTMPPAAAPQGGGSDMMMAGLGNALRDPGEGWKEDAPLGASQAGLGTRTSSQPMDILRQIVGRRGRVY